MTDRITKRDRFAQLFEVVAALPMDDPKRNDLLYFIIHEVELYDKRAATKSGPTADQIANVTIKEDIVFALDTAEVPLRAGEVAAMLDLPIQKMTALLKQLVDSDEVTRNEGKVVTFTLK